MAFVEERLKSIGGQDNQDFGGDVFSYVPLPATTNPTVPEDTLAQISAADYFLTGEQNFNVDDIIRIINSEGQLDVVVATSTENGVTVAPSAGSVQQITDAGAVSLGTELTEITTTTASALTLANGTVGQRKTIIAVVISGTATLSGSFFDTAARTGLPFTVAGDAVELIFTNTLNWYILDNNGVTPT